MAVEFRFRLKLGNLKNVKRIMQETTIFSHFSRSSAGVRIAISTGMLMVACTGVLLGQGTIGFNFSPYWYGTSYQELGMRFQVVVPPGTSGYDVMGITLGAGNTPQNGTTFMDWFRVNNPYQYVELTLTNGSTFGLASVQLADPINPSPSVVPIAFVGYLSDGTSLTNTFSTPGAGPSTFAPYTFNSDFSSATLTRVDIFAPRWAMDNLVFVIPEPGFFSLFGIGALALLWLQLSRRRRL